MSACAILLYAAAAAACAGPFESGTCYKTGHYKSLAGASATASAAGCCAACAADAKCLSFTLHGAPTKSPAACMLKSVAPGERERDAGCASGAPGGAPPTPPTPAIPTPPPPPGPGAPPPAPTPPLPPPPGGRPNILFVLTDDQDALLNGYNASVGVAHMARLNARVRAKGVLFTNYYLAYPLCSPSRASILTGLFPHNHGLGTNAELNSSGFHPREEAASVATWLQDAGYHTMLSGKYMNGYHAGKVSEAAHYLPAGWGDFYGFQTVDYFGTAVNECEHSSSASEAGSGCVSRVYPKAAYQTDIISNTSVRWLADVYDRAKPFFMMLTPHAPHEPYTPAPRHAGTLAGLRQPVDAAMVMTDAMMAKLPGTLATLPAVNNSKAYDAIYQKRAEQLLGVDEMIGAVLDQIESMGLADNTYVFFSCDNGYHLGQHRMPPGKREAFQHDINVALIVSGPGIAAGGTVHALAGNYDLAPTWAELGAARPGASAAPLDGRSLVPLLLGGGSGGGAAGEDGTWPRTFTLQEGYQSCEQGNGEGKACEKKPPHQTTPSAAAARAVAAKGRDYSALRLKDGRDALYVEYVDGGKMYFDSAADPWQTLNIFNTLSTNATAQLAQMLADVKDCSGVGEFKGACP